MSFAQATNLSSFNGHDLVRYGRSHAGLFPIMSASGWGREPALSIINDLIAFILSPPFSYPWNRLEAQVQLSPGVQDVSIGFPTGTQLSLLEKATLQIYAGVILTLTAIPTNGGSGFVSGDVGTQLKINTGNGNAQVTIQAVAGGAVTQISTTPLFGGYGYTVGTNISTTAIQSAHGIGCTISIASVSTACFNKELSIRHVLALDTSQKDPDFICVLNETGSNPNTQDFRVFPSPDQSYYLDILGQCSPVKITSLTTQLNPIPDRYIHILYQGFLAKCYEAAGDPRSDVAMDLFIRQVIGMNTGLSDVERNIFLSERLLTMADVQRVSTLRNLQTTVQPLAGQPRG